MAGDFLKHARTVSLLTMASRLLGMVRDAALAFQQAAVVEQRFAVTGMTDDRFLEHGHGRGRVSFGLQGAGQVTACLEGIGI